MATQADAQELRRQWEPDILGKYEGEWIAFINMGVRDSDVSLDILSSRFQIEINNGESPIFAFVTFKDLQ